MSDPKQRFTGLYDEYYRRVLRYALQHAGPGGAEDIASETFLIARRRLDDVPRAAAAVAPWRGAEPAWPAIQARPAAAAHPRNLGVDHRCRRAGLDAGEHVIERAAALEALGSLPDTDVETLTLVTSHGLGRHRSGVRRRLLAARVHSPAAPGQEAAGRDATTGRAVPASPFR